MNKKISVTVPIYNTEKYLSRCLDSILIQTYRNLEIIIVNDCTPDNSMQIVESYLKRDNRIRVVNHHSNQGLMMARKTGYEAATGDFIVFLDSDDALTSNSLQLLYNEAMRTGADIVGGVLSFISNSGEVNNDKYPCRLKYGTDRVATIKSTLLWEMTHNLCGKLFKKELFEGKSYITYPNSVIGEDGMLFYQILDIIDSASSINDVVYLYYQNQDSSTHRRYNEKSLMSFFNFIDIRYRIVSNYSILNSLLNISTITKLADLRGRGYSLSVINEHLNSTSIPFKLCFKAIVTHCGFFNSLKCLILVYIVGPIRTYRLHNS